MRAITVLTTLAVGMAAVPALASAATVDVESGLAVYRGGGSANDVTVRRVFTTVDGFTFADALQPLVAGDGCDATVPIFCAASGPDVRLGAGDDRADVVTSGEPVAYVSGGDGRDRILAAGGGNVVTGGAGDDAIAMWSEGRGTTEGNGGDDTLLAAEGDAQLAGGAGGDLLVGASRSADLSGGDGDDELVTYTGGSMSGGAGRDVLAVRSGGGLTLDGGRDGDLIAGGFGADTVIGAQGNDVIDVSGDPGEGPDHVSCGSGIDTVYADADDVVDGDCENRRSGPMPATGRLTGAIADAEAVLAQPRFPL